MSFKLCHLCYLLLLLLTGIDVLGGVGVAAICTDVLFVEEALVETLGCSGMTHSAAMAGEILPGKTLLECLNTDLVCLL